MYYKEITHFVDVLKFLVNFKYKSWLTIGGNAKNCILILKNDIKLDTIKKILN
jgi:hypothetical protein